MAALVRLKQQPLLIQLPSGALVPSSGMASATPPQPIAAEMDNSGALIDPHVQAAGAGGGTVAPSASAGDVATALATHTGGGAAHGALIDDPKQPAPLVAKDPSGGADSGLSTILSLAKMAGKGGDGGAAGAVANDNGGGGIMDKLRDLFHGKGDGVTPPVPETISRAFTDSAMDRSMPKIAAADPALGLPTDAPRPIARPDQVGDPPDPRQVVANGIPDAPGMSDAEKTTAIAADTTLPAKEPNFLDKLRANPLALALITGGLQTMSAASRPGATALGALGEGAIGGLRGAFEMDQSQRDEARNQEKEDLAASREASESALRLKQGAFYDARTTAEPEKTGALVTRANADQTKAGAAVTTAGARVTSADAAKTRADAYAKYGVGPGGSKSTALIKNAQFYVDNGIAPDLKSATTMLHSSVNDANTFQRLVQAEKKLITGSMQGMDMSDADAEMLAQNNVRARAQSAAGGGSPAPAKAGPALGSNPAPAKGGTNTGALMDQARAAIKRGADPAAVKARLQKMGGNPGAL